MKKFLKGHNAKDKLKVFIVSFLAITFLAIPVLAEEMSPEEKLAKATELSTRASEMAIKAKETGDAELAKEAMAIANEASRLIADIASYASETGNAELAQAAMNMTNNLDAAINQIMDTAQYIAQTSTDPGVVDAANEILAKAEETQNRNNSTMKILIASGAVPGTAEAYEPPLPGLETPVDEEPPIQDTEPASPV
ncbi:MAG: hypothetical protein U9R21_02610 [Candidatus Thermoplasmatota archaeon]|nr:hypothetical protein [Candidatus Thermoplasmatota archaeon]